MMVVGSTIDDVMTVQPPSANELKQLQTDTTGTQTSLPCKHPPRVKANPPSRTKGVPQ